MVRAKAGVPVLPDMSWVPAPLAPAGEIAGHCTASFGHVRVHGFLLIVRNEWLRLPPWSECHTVPTVPGCCYVLRVV